MFSGRCGFIFDCNIEHIQLSVVLASYHCLKYFGLDFELVVNYNECGREDCQEEIIHCN